MTFGTLVLIYFFIGIVTYSSFMAFDWFCAYMVGTTPLEFFKVSYENPDGVKEIRKGDGLTEHLVTVFCFCVFLWWLVICFVIFDSIR